MSEKKLNWGCKDTQLGIIMLVIGVVYGIMVLQIPGTASQLFDSRFVPALVSILIILVGILQLGRGLQKPVEEKENKEFDTKTVICTFILIAAYILFYSSIGFIVTTFIFLFLEMNILTPSYVNKNQLVYLAIALIFSVGIYYLFYYGFSIFLPGGILEMIL